jgi:mRNA interferase MazF
MNKKPSRGEVWFVSLDPTIGHEQAKTRPCLVISHDTFNHGPALLHTILPLTSKNKKHPFRVPVKWEQGNFQEESFILCDQIRTVSRQRFRGSSIGKIDEDTLIVVVDLLSILLDI